MKICVVYKVPNFFHTKFADRANYIRLVLLILPLIHIVQLGVNLNKIKQTNDCISSLQNWMGVHLPLFFHGLDRSDRKGVVWYTYFRWSFLTWASIASQVWVIFVQLGQVHWNTIGVTFCKQKKMQHYYQIV